MKRRLCARLTGGLSLLAFASAFGCESQVDDEYTGEPLLSLQGNVLVSEEQVDTNLLPYLAFSVQDEVVFVGGEVTGEFPAKFRFDVTQPPPAGALREVNELGFSGRMATAFLVMLPPDHPKRIAEWLDTEYLDSQCTEDFSECTYRVEQCDATTERCRERTYECTERPCDLVERTADPGLDSTTLMEKSASRCVGQSCDLIESQCDAAGNCAIDAYTCDYARYGSLETFGEGTMTTCTLLSESGDLSVTSFNDLQTVALGYMVAYVSDDATDSLYGPLKQGYNLFALPEAGVGHSDWVASTTCAIRGEAKAVAEYNEEHGTSYSIFDDEVTHLELAAEEECGLGWGTARLIERPLDAPLTIELGDARPELF
jgi:hypothetical protein